MWTRFQATWLLTFAALVAPVTAANELYAPPSAADVRSRSLEWFAGRQISQKAVLDDVARLWALGNGEFTAAQLFDKVIATFCLADPEAKKLVDACHLAVLPLLPPKPAVFSGNPAESFYAANLRLFFARYLAQRSMYDEALDQFAQLDPKQVVDPATCLYFKAVCQHQLLLKEEGLATIASLLHDTEAVPVRYSTVAKLMQYDLEQLREKSLDEIARRMKDVERRLDLGRGGQRVQQEEDQIIATLDEIIEKLEQQGGT